MFILAEGDWKIPDGANGVYFIGWFLSHGFLMGVLVTGTSNAQDQRWAAT